MSVSRVLQATAALVAVVQAHAGCNVDHLSGHIDRSQVHDYIYVPFEVKPGVTSITIAYEYPEGDGNTLDIGLFDERGYQIEDALNSTAGFRGWSFSMLDTFTLTPGWTTPSYISGPIAHGTWNIVLGPRGVNSDEGFDWTANITYGYKPVNEHFSPSVAPIELGIGERLRDRVDERDGRVWLRGDFHVHSIYSDGAYLPEEQVANAQTQDLDFFYFTEHNSHSGNDVWGVWAPDDMLVGRGMEVTTRHGHWQAVGLERGHTVEWRYGPNSTAYANAAKRVRRSGGFVSVNHPYMDCVECLWNIDPEFEHNDAMEVWNGSIGDLNEPAITLWQRLLVAGRRITGIGGSDTHNPPSMIGVPTTYVKSRSLSSAAIVEGVIAGRVYMVELPEMEMDFTVQGDGVYAQVGDVVKAEQRKADLEASVTTAGLNGMTLCWVSQEGYVRNETIAEDAVPSLVVDAEIQFLRVEVRNSTGSLVGLSNPIWLD